MAVVLVSASSSDLHLLGQLSDVVFDVPDRGGGEGGGRGKGKEK